MYKFYYNVPAHKSSKGNFADTIPYITPLLLRQPDTACREWEAALINAVSSNTNIEPELHG